MKFKVWDTKEKRFYNIDNDLYWFKQNNINPLADSRYTLLRNTNNFDAEHKEIFEYDYLEIFMSPNELKELDKLGNKPSKPSYIAIVVYRKDMFNLITDITITKQSLSLFRLEHNTYIRGNILEHPEILEEHNIKI